MNRPPHHRRDAPTMLGICLVMFVLLLPAACGKSSAADRDPLVINGKRIDDGGVEEWDLPAAGEAAPDPVAAPAGGPLRPDKRSSSGPPKVLVAGDSVAFYLSVPIVNGAKDLGITARSQANQVCGVIKVGRIRNADGSVSDSEAGCRWPDEWAATELDTFDPDIVLIALGAPPLVDLEIDGEFAAPCSNRFDAWYTSRFRALIDQLSAEGAFVAIANTAYPITFPEIPDGKRRTDCLNTDIAAAAVGRHAAVIDLLNFTCPNRVCSNERNGVVMRPDGIHYGPEGSNIVAAWLVPEALRAAGY